MYISCIIKNGNKMKFINIIFTFFIMSSSVQQNAFGSFPYDKQKEGNSAQEQRNSIPLFNTENIQQVSKDGTLEYQMAVQYHMHHVYKAQTNERCYIEEAIRLYSIAIEKGNSGAMCNLAGLYQEGIHIEQDYEKAIELYNTAIEAGNNYAKSSLINLCNKIFENPKVENADLLFLIGSMYEIGFAVDQDLEKAVNFYNLSIDMGNKEAAYDLALLYQKDKNVMQNGEEIVRLYKIAIQNNNCNAMYNLAIIYYQGDGVERDFEETVRFLNLAVENGHKHAAEILGSLYYYGEEINQDLMKAAKFYEIAFENGEILGSRLLNLSHLYDEGNGVKQDLQRAKLLFKISLQKLHREIEQNSEEALETLCDLYYSLDNHKLVSMVRIACNSLQGDNSYLWDDELLCLKTMSQLFKFRNAKFEQIATHFPCIRQNDYLNNDFQENGQEYFDFMINNTLHLQKISADKEINNFLSTDKGFKNIHKIVDNFDLQLTPKRQFGKISKHAVEILSYAPVALNDNNCFIPVSDRVYDLFPCAQWNGKQKNCIKFPLETSRDVGMRFYKIQGKCYVTLKQKNVDNCDKLMTALYKPTVRNLERQNLEIMTNCFVSIQREFETCLDHTAPRKIQKLYINKKFDETIKNGLLFS